MKPTSFPSGRNRSCQEMHLLRCLGRGGGAQLQHTRTKVGTYRIGVHLAGVKLSCTCTVRLGSARLGSPTPRSSSFDEKRFPNVSSSASLPACCCFFQPNAVVVLDVKLEKISDPTPRLRRRQVDARDGSIIKVPFLYFRFRVYVKAELF